MSLANQGKPYREPVTDLKVQVWQAALSQLVLLKPGRHQGRSSHISSYLPSFHSPIKSTFTLQSGEGKVYLLQGTAFFPTGSVYRVKLKCFLNTHSSLLSLFSKNLSWLFYC